MIRSCAWALTLWMSFIGGAVPPVNAADFVRTVRPVLVEHCFDCHDDETQKGGVNLARFRSAESLFQDPKLWENAVRQIREGSMPPRNKPHPAGAVRLALVGQLEEILDNPEPGWVSPDPGPRIPHRLSRTEYNNTVRDLLGMDARPADQFPPDGGGGGGFDNNAATLFLPPVLFERYLAAADDLISRAPKDRLISVEPTWYSPGSWAARENLSRFARRAFRSPVRTHEIEPYLRLYERARREGADFEQAMRVALKGVMVSPRFLFRLEPVVPGKGVRPVDDHSLASRLSYFLWSSMPDDALLTRADSGTLRDPAVLRVEVERMWNDPKARDFAARFVGQWLGTANLAQTANPDLNRFPEYTVELRDSMVAEPVEMFLAMIRENASLLDLIDGRYTYANGLLARFYGLPQPPDGPFQRIDLPDRRRGGVLGMAAVLTRTSYPLRTSPVLRGKWILEEVLGTPPPPPPPLVATLPPDDNPREGQSLRQRLEAHRKKESCAACHARLDPLGFALENFDPIGRWRSEIQKQPVDSTGVLPGGEVVDGPVSLKEALLRRKGLFLRHLTEKMLAYALGRGLEAYDIPEVKRIVSEVEREGYRIQTLVWAVIRSVPFQNSRGNGS